MFRVREGVKMHKRSVVLLTSQVILVKNDPVILCFSC